MAPKVYYHIFANPGGVAIAKSQIEKIRRFVRGASIYCGIVEVDPDAVAELRGHLATIPNLEVIGSEPTGNEWVTLGRLHDDCSKRWDADQPILYCHTKGAYSSQLQPTIVPIWREWMEYFAFYRSPDALKALADGYTAYGFDAVVYPRRPLLRRLGFPARFWYYSGNYWWSTAGAIRRIKLAGIDRELRHTAEARFIRLIPRIKAFDALQLIGLPSILAGCYTNYSDHFQHFPALMEKAGVLEEMRAQLGPP